MKKKANKAPSPQSVMLAFKSFALDATEKELDSALKNAGESPDELVIRANAAIESALRKASKQIPRETRNVKSDDGVKLALHKGMSTLIGLLRRKSGLTELELAAAADVDAMEIRQIEVDENYSPSPRTVYQLEEYFQLPERSLVLMSGAVSSRSTEFTNEVLRFAAHSKEIGKLSREEKKLLNSFVQFLANELKKRD